jgi:hypothetical protein
VVGSEANLGGTLSEDSAAAGLRAVLPLEKHNLELPDPLIFLGHTET